MSEWNIVEYNEKDRKSCIDLLKRTFPGTSDEKTFAWRFESESGLAPLLVCAKDVEKIVSFNSWIPWKFEYNNHLYIGYQSGESATDSNYRRRGIFGRVLNYAEELARARNVDFFFGFPSAMSYNAFYNAGYYSIGIFNFNFRIINPLKGSDRTVCRILPGMFPSQTLVEQWKITPLVNSEYMEWRYIKNPKGYDLISYEENNNQAIFVVRKGKYWNKRYGLRINELILLDCQFNSFNETFIRNAFEYIDGLFSRKVIYMRTFLNENTDRGKSISKHFHFQSRSLFETLIIKPLRKSFNFNVLCNRFNWDIMPHLKDAM